MVSSLYISFQGRTLELERRPDPLKENGHKFLPKAPIASKLHMALERTHPCLFFEDRRVQRNRLATHLRKHLVLFLLEKSVSFTSC